MDDDRSEDKSCEHKKMKGTRKRRLKEETRVRGKMERGERVEKKGREGENRRN